jgi:hypothetical protein
MIWNDQNHSMKNHSGWFDEISWNDSHSIEISVQMFIHWQIIYHHSNQNWNTYPCVNQNCRQFCLKFWTFRCISNTKTHSKSFIWMNWLKRSINPSISKVKPLVHHSRHSMLRIILRNHQSISWINSIINLNQSSWCWKYPIQRSLCRFHVLSSLSQIRWIDVIDSTHSSHIRIIDDKWHSICEVELRSSSSSSSSSESESQSESSL